MTKEQMEQFDPMDRVDIEIERGFYNGEDKHKTFKKPFSPSIGYYQPVKTDEDGMII